MTAEQWYKEFWKRSLKAKKLNQKCSTSKYTKQMDAFLRGMADDLGFGVPEPENPVFGGKRIDQLWRKGNFEIAIEHENDHSGISNEIRKLCKNKSNLKVLITYVEDKDFVFRAHEIAKRVENEITQLGPYREEFLLVVGDYGEYDWCADWAAFHSVTTTSMELLRGQHARQGKKT